MTIKNDNNHGKVISKMIRFLLRRTEGPKYPGKCSVLGQRWRGPHMEKQIKGTRKDIKEEKVQKAHK